MEQEQDLKKVGEELNKIELNPQAEDSSPIAFSNLPDDERLMKEREIIDSLMNKFNKREAWRKGNYEPTWDEIYRLYINYQQPSKTPTRSKITVPIVFQIIESAIPKIVNTIFSTDDSFFEVIPQNKDDQEKAEHVQNLLTYQLTMADFFSKFLDFTKQLLLYGTSYFKVYWKVKRDWVWERTPKRTVRNILGFSLGTKLTWEDKKVYKVIERRPEIDVLDILDVYPDPEARNEKDSDIFVRSWMDIADFKVMGQGRFPVYANTDRDDLQGDKNSFALSRQMRMSVRGGSTAGVGKDQVELLEYWGPYDVDGDGIKEQACIVIANRKVVVKAIGNPFFHQKKPVIRAVLYPVPMEWYGIGLVEPIISMKHELDTLRRQRLDNINQSLNRMWKVNTLADVDLESLISAPNNIVLTDDMTAVEALESNDVTQTNYQEAAQVQSDIENATTPRSAQGTPESGRLGRTARGAQLIIGQALEKFGLSTKLIEEMGIKKILRMFHQLNLQFIDSDDILHNPGLYGSYFEQVSPEDIRAEVEFKMIGISEMIGTEGKINQAVSFMGVFGKVLSPLSIQTIAQMVWKLMGFNKKDIVLQGMAPQPGEGPIVDPSITAAIQGQAGNQGAGAPVAIPGVGAGGSNGQPGNGTR